MSLETHTFRFGEFLLDSKEKVLLCDEKPLSITPKSFLLLLTLLQYHGHIVEKEKLIRAVWADSIVEDGNLTFTVNLLRKALGDCAQNPRYIETVPRRGYRFIGSVTEYADGIGDMHKKQVAAAPSLKSPANPSRLKHIIFVAILGFSVIISSVAVWLWFSGAVGQTKGAFVLTSPFRTEKISSDGSVHHIVVSPDAKHIVYTSVSGGRQGIWLRQVDSTTNVEIIPGSNDFYGGLALSPDGLFIYFSRTPRNAEGQLDIFRVSIFGGIPSKIVADTQGWIDVSKDGTKISFVRCYYREDENCSLWIANAADGKQETRLAVRQKPLRIGENRFSPDGRTIAFASGQSDNQSDDFSLMSVDIATRQERKLVVENFFNIKGIAWLPDQSELIFTAAKIPTRHYRIWKADARTGQSEPITDDSESYSSLRLDAAASILVTTRVEPNFRLNLYDLKSLSASPKVLADAVSIDFGPKGQIVFESESSGNREIWTIASDGNARRQLTNHPADDASPILSTDASSIFFSSNRTGSSQIWQMSADGSKQRQISTPEGGFPIFAGPDGSWVYYLSGKQRWLRRVSVTDGNDELILPSKLSRVAFDPDGSRAAYCETIEGKRDLVVVSIPGGGILSRHNVAGASNRLTGLDWSGDSKTIAYVLSQADQQKNTVWLLSPSSGNRKQIADLGSGEVAEQAGFRMSPDGKLFAVGMGGWKHDAVMFERFK